ncbi:Uma2 family endonuclease [Streptomyces sp. JJ66]|uniref:Uma2 family endonuclease n=1 Tax=Streptomyces sp. JJ66 TaxID=2803843 RepID=UPI0027E30D3D|nr:Uma2 family endonuclease [Streptomyces sp. JJ66]
MALAAPEREPSAAAEERHAAVEDAFEALSAAAPEGWRVELVEGEIHVVPPANGDHEEVVSELSGQVRDHRKDLGRYTNLGLRLPGTAAGGQVPGKVIPDLVLAPKGSFSGSGEYHDPDPVLLVAEVTSASTGGNDRMKKLRAYARAGIPHYLLIDREAGRVTLYSDPRSEHYARSSSADISAKISLPDPLGFDLDTGQFPLA